MFFFQEVLRIFNFYLDLRSLQAFPPSLNGIIIYGTSESQ